MDIKIESEKIDFGYGVKVEENKRWWIRGAEAMQDEMQNKFLSFMQLVKHGNIQPCTDNPPFTWVKIDQLEYGVYSEYMTDDELMEKIKSL